MRDYSKISNEELKAIVFKHYSDEELKEMFELSEQQIKEGKFTVMTSDVLDDMFNRHAVL